VARTPTRIGRYELLTALATGGMGRIYLGKLTGPGGFERKVVIKTLEQPVDSEDDPAITMFLDEARVLGLLHHQHIASVFEVGRDDDGRFFIVLDYVDGYSAHDVWERAVQLDAALPLDFTLTVVSAAANGLHYAHTRTGAGGAPLGIVHRDVTPSNVMIGHDGSVKLIDFGIAMAANRKTKTQTGFVKGKVGYLSPEQVVGHELDARTDVFALGILLYELSTLHWAFREPTDLATMQRIKLGSVVRPSQLVSDYQPELEAIVLKALQVDPRDRFVNAEAMRRAIEALGHRLHFVLGDAAVIEVMAQLYEPAAPGTSPRPPSRVSESELEWAESDRDLTVRRDPAELLAAMRAEIASAESDAAATRPLASAQIAQIAHVRPRKLRAATEAADALIIQINETTTAPFTPPTPLPVVSTKPAATRVEGGKPEGGKLEGGKLEGGKPEGGKLEGGQPDDAKPDDAKPVVVKPVVVKPVVVKPVVVKPVVVKPVVVRSAKPSPAPARLAIGAGRVRGQTSRSSRLRWIGAIVVLGALGGGAYLVTPDSADAVAGSAAPPAIVPVAVSQHPPAPPDAPPAPPPPDAPPPAPAKVRVRIATHPADATVLLDGKRLGHTPLDETIDADPGKHVMKLRHRGYVTQVFDVTLDADVTQDLTLVPASPSPK
jgi:serine/threonine protein kinase